MGTSEETGSESVPARRWPVSVVLKLADKLIAPALVGAVLLVVGPTLGDRYAIRNPTCDDPRGALPLASGEEDVSVSRVQKLEGRNWGKGNLVDGNTATEWVPQKVSEEGGQDIWIRLNLDDREDLQLICVVNGVAKNGISYLRAERVRTAYVRTDTADDDEELPVSSLLSLDECEIQNFQSLEFKEGPTDNVKIVISDTYSGQVVYEPSGDEYIPQYPTHFIAMAEVELYVKDPSAPSVWEVWQTE